MPLFSRHHHRPVKHDSKHSLLLGKQLELCTPAPSRVPSRCALSATSPENYKGFPLTATSPLNTIFPTQTTLCHVGDRSSTHTPRTTSRFPLLPVYSLSYSTTFPHHRRHLQPPHRRVKHNPKPSLLLERLWAFFPSVILFHPWSPSPTLQYLPRPDNQSLPRGLAPQSRRGPTFTAFPSSTIRCHLLSASDSSHAAVPSITNFHLLSASDTSHAAVQSIFNCHHLRTKASSFLFPSSIFHLKHDHCYLLPVLVNIQPAYHLSVSIWQQPPVHRVQVHLVHHLLQAQPSHLAPQPPTFFYPSFHPLPSERLLVLATVRTATTDTAARHSRSRC